MQIIQLNPALPLLTSKGKALAHFLIDYGIESAIYFVCFLDDSGQCWTFSNEDIRAQTNITIGRFMHNKPVWEKQNPKEKSKKLTPKQKAKAKAIAKKSGSVYPSLVANIQAARKK